MNGIDPHRDRTLLLAALLHAFTNIYHVALMPLYLPMVADLGLTGVDQATSLVTVMMVAYFLPAFGVGILADRFSRKRLLALGLLVNGIGFFGLSLARDQATAVAWVALAGLGGSLFHPAATALVARLYPDRTGRALGLLGIGASLGFFIGPLYSGWRAEAAGWRAPVAELGLAGVAMAGIFWWLAAEAPGEASASADGSVARPRRMPLFPAPAFLVVFVATAVGFALRDFAGAGNGTLCSLYLQKAHGDSVEGAGRVLSLMFVASALSNPVFGHLSDRGRLTWAGALMAVSAVLLGLLPWTSRAAFPWALATFGFFFMAVYPVVEAAVMQAVPDAVRGRAFGFFITVGGLLGNSAHWVLGRAVRALGDRASDPGAYRVLFGALAVMLVVALAALPGVRYFERAWRRLIAGGPPGGHDIPR